MAVQFGILYLLKYKEKSQNIRVKKANLLNDGIRISFICMQRATTMPTKNAVACHTIWKEAFARAAAMNSLFRQRRRYGEIAAGRWSQLERNAD